METHSYIGKRVIIIDGEQDCGNDFSIEKEMLESVGATLDVAKCKTESEIIRAAQSYDVLITIRMYTPVTKYVIQRLTKCSMIMRYAVGYDNIDVDAATDKGIVVAHAPAFCTEEVADHAVAMMMALSRNIFTLDQFVRNGNWSNAADFTGKLCRLSSLTLGIVGLGRIGKQVARRMSSVVGTVIVCDPYITEDVARTHGVRLVTLEELLNCSDIVTLHVPLLPTTRHLIGGPQLSCMKSTAILVNTSRGPVIDETELVQVLQAKEIAGVALDVFEEEPLLQTSPLRNLGNVLLSPHFAWYSIDSLRDLSISVAESVTDFLQGYWPAYVVNPEVESRTPLTRKEQS